jgi:type IV pilus assembly protein PilB
LASIEALSESAPVRKLLNMVFLLGIKDHASDLHFEPFEDEFKIRIKADGTLYEMVPPPRHLASAITTRIKVMANLDIAERRLPQDGRIRLTVGGHPVDLRVSVLPTLFGESVVCRILDKSVISLDLENVGMDAMLLRDFRKILERPNGIVLVTGPTGSGKTTTLYAALSELNTITDKLMTTEDPVEYDIDGIIQMPIDAEIGNTFAQCLRSILRQDPDIILVGEIRDRETAEIAVQASLTGHLVFSTLHTNDAPSTITRMKDMGSPSFLITATVEAILAQRLVRTICSDCREQYTPTPDQLAELELGADYIAGKMFYRGRGCVTCNNTGYRGRTAIHEFMLINDEIRALINHGASAAELREAAARNGMITLREAGLAKIHTGKTTIDEVVRETVID